MIHTFIQQILAPRYLQGIIQVEGFPGGASGKEPTNNVGDLRDMGSTPGSGRSPGGGHGNPLHYSCMENPTRTPPPQRSLGSYSP